MWTNLGSGVITGLWSAIISVCRAASINTRGCEWPSGHGARLAVEGSGARIAAGRELDWVVDPLWTIAASPVIIISRHPEYTNTSSTHEPEKLIRESNFSWQWLPSSSHRVCTFQPPLDLSPRTIIIHGEQKPSKDNCCLTNSLLLIGQLWAFPLMAHFLSHNGASKQGPTNITWSKFSENGTWRQLMQSKGLKQTLVQVFGCCVQSNFLPLHHVGLDINTVFMLSSYPGPPWWWWRCWPGAGSR